MTSRRAPEPVECLSSVTPRRTDPRMKLLLRPCPACGSTRGEVLHRQHFASVDEFGLEDAVDIVACAHCGLGFSDISVAQDDLDKVYEAHSKYADTTLYGAAPGDEVEGTPSAGPSEAPWDLERLEGTAAWLAGHLENPSVRILDAGCATGGLLGFLKERGFSNLVGLDPSPVATATARRLHGVEAITGSFMAPLAGVGRFDLVVLSHVLEHLEDVGAAVSAMWELTCPGGLVYLEVPDAQRYAEFLVAPFHDFNTEHINHFSLRLLDAVMKAHGFELLVTERNTVRCSPTDPYPVAFGLWRRPRDQHLVPISVRDEALVAALRTYVSRSNELLHRIDQNLTERLAGCDGVIVWGAGQLAMKLLSDSVLSRLPVVAVVDSSPQKHGLHLRGIEIVGPESIKVLPYPIVVASVHHEASILGSIAAQGISERTVITIPRL